MRDALVDHLGENLSLNLLELTTARQFAPLASARLRHAGSSRICSLAAADDGRRNGIAMRLPISTTAVGIARNIYQPEEQA